ncbi:MAG: metalloregulator ArsR/SmtB family transcription factor [Candidatus Sphingomonas colombiensis]|nr:metalloregulator ArsR/SmtB family transcription factor [Sphingomonas sp.]WEK42458.1 MAG: metalloregulator ArsR/SmtB family transcription factor [Sphingomonas sp.]
MSKNVDRGRADAMVERLRAFAQPQRLMVLAILLDGEQTVGEIETATGIGQPALSQQLAELRRAGLVATRRAARQVHYSIADEDTEERVRILFAAFSAVKPVARAKHAEAKRQRVPSSPIGAASFARIG